MEENDERPCDCGECRSCDAHTMSDVDYDTCACGGGGCARCESDE